MGSYTGQGRRHSPSFCWIKFALLGVVVSVLIQGASCEVEPTESQCRPYIEKALKEQHLEAEERTVEEGINPDLLNEQEEISPTGEITDSTEGSIPKDEQGDEDRDDEDEAADEEDGDMKKEDDEDDDDVKKHDDDDDDDDDDGDAKTEEVEGDAEDDGDENEHETESMEKDGVEVESREDADKEDDETKEDTTENEDDEKDDEKDEDTAEDAEDVDDEKDNEKDEDTAEDADDDKEGEKDNEGKSVEKEEIDEDDHEQLDLPIQVEVQEIQIDDDDDDKKFDKDDEADDDQKETDDEQEDDRKNDAEDEKDEDKDDDDDDDDHKADKEDNGDDDDDDHDQKTDEEDDDDKKVDTEEEDDDKKLDTEEEEDDDKKIDTEEDDDDDKKAEEMDDVKEEDTREDDDDKKAEEEEEEEEKDEDEAVEEKEKEDEDEEEAEKKAEKDEEADEDDKDETKEDEGDEDKTESSDKTDEVEEEMVKMKVSKVEKEPAAAESEEAEGSKDDKDQDSTPEEEELIKEVVVPENLRPRDHITKILKLEENTETETTLEKAIDTTLKSLKALYDNAIKPLEMLYKYRDLSNRHFGDPEIFSKPLILFMGPWSGGKSSTINYLLDNEYTHTSLRTGAEPSPAYFNILMYGEEEEILDGTQLAADWTFSGLQKFGQGLLDRLKGIKLNNKLLEKVNIVEIPGILEIRKQVQRLFPFNDACQWFIDRADIIFLVYDPSKLDVGPETEAILDQLKGREYQTRIILNKADQVKPEELMRVQGTLIWNISPLMSSSEPPIMYSTSLWSLPYEAGAPTRLLLAQERAFLRDLREAIDKRVENKISSARRFAVRVRNHAKMVDCYLTTYYNHKSFFGNKKKISDDIIEYPQKYHIYEGLSTLTNISRYDLPDPDVYRDFFKINPLYEFKKLSETCTYFRGCPINKLDVAIAYDLPELVGKYKKAVESAKEQIPKENS